MRLLGMTFSTILLPAALLLVILTVATRDIDKDSNADHLWRLWSQQHAGEAARCICIWPGIAAGHMELTNVCN